RMSEATSGTVLTASTRISLRSCGRQPALSAAIFPRHARARSRACAGCVNLPARASTSMTHKQDVDGRDISAFTRVFDALCPAMTVTVQKNTSNVLSEMENSEKNVHIAFFLLHPW